MRRPFGARGPPSPASHSLTTEGSPHACAGTLRLRGVLLLSLRRAGLTRLDCFRLDFRCAHRRIGATLSLLCRSAAHRIILQPEHNAQLLAVSDEAFPDQRACESVPINGALKTVRVAANNRVLQLRLWLLGALDSLLVRLEAFWHAGILEVSGASEGTLYIKISCRKQERQEPLVSALGEFTCAGQHAGMSAHTK